MREKNGPRWRWPCPHHAFQEKGGGGRVGIKRESFTSTQKIWNCISVGSRRIYFGSQRDSSKHFRRCYCLIWESRAAARGGYWPAATSVCSLSEVGKLLLLLLSWEADMAAVRHQYRLMHLFAVWKFGRINLKKWKGHFLTFDIWILC